MVTWKDVQAQEEELRELTGEIAQMEARVQEEQEKQMADAVLRQQMQQAKTAARKREEASAKLEKLRERLRAVQSEYGEKAASAEHTRAASLGEAGAAAAELSTAEDLQARQESVRAKLERYRPLKRELEEQMAETKVLEYTEGVLSRQEKTLSELLGAVALSWGMPN